MMPTWTELRDQGHRRIRHPIWNQSAYVELPEEGVWASLVDPPSQKAIGIPVGSQKLCTLIHLDGQAWEPFTGEPWPDPLPPP